MKMKTKVFFVILVLFAGISATKVKYKDYEKKAYLVGPDKKTFVYYSFSKKKPFVAAVSGKANYKLYIRGKIACRVSVSLDGAKIKDIDISGKVADGYTFEGEKNPPTKAEVFTLKLGPGRHTLELSTDSGVAYARIVKQSSKSWVKAIPDNYARAVVLRSKGKSYEYYEATKDSPVVVKLKQPSKVKIRSRILLPRGIENKSFEYSYIVELGGKKTEIKVNSNGSTSSLIDGLPCTKSYDKILKTKQNEMEIRLYPSGNTPVYFSVYIPRAGKK